jgi:uncharacterized membrane protein
MIEMELSQAHQKLHAFNRILSAVIRTGIFISLVLMVAGLVIYMVRGDNEAGQLTPVLSIALQLVKLDPASFITLGLYVLLLMPPAILLASFVHFIATRNVKAIIVCAVLILFIAGLQLTLIFH